MTVQSQAAYVQRVNCGGASYTDDKGNVWGADQAYTAGSWGYTAGNTYTTSDAIANTADDLLYQSERWGLQGYRFDVENGEYQVTLFFAEIYFHSTDKRVFHVDIEGTRVLNNYDIFAEAGHDYATQKNYTVLVTDNQLNINFVKYIEDPKISAIEVVRNNSDKMLDQNTLFVNNASVNEAASIPETFALFQNCPNPFNPETVIGYQLSKESTVRLDIYNIRGQLVRQCVNEVQPAGVHQVRWDGKDDNGQILMSGIYIYILKTADFVQSKRMILLR